MGWVFVVFKFGFVVELCGIGGGVMGELGYVVFVVRVGYWYIYVVYLWIGVL